MSITFGDRLIDSGHYDITPEQEREIEAREECARRGLDPDDDAADGVTVWMVVDKEMRERRPVPQVREALAQQILDLPLFDDNHVAILEAAAAALTARPSDAAVACAGGIDPGFDECPKCGATMDDACVYAEPSADSEDTSIGGLTWHSSEEDGGPDVGISVYLGKDDRLWAGEISRRTFEEWGADINFDGDDGKFLVRYVGKDVKIIAKFGDYDEHLQEFMEQIAAWVRALPPDEPARVTPSTVGGEATTVLIGKLRARAINLRQRDVNAVGEANVGPIQGFFDWQVAAELERLASPTIASEKEPVQVHNGASATECDHLTTEKAGIAKALEDLLGSSLAVHQWLTNWSYPFEGETEWIGDRDLFKQALNEAARALAVHDAARVIANQENLSRCEPETPASLIAKGEMPLPALQPSKE